METQRRAGLAHIPALDGARGLAVAGVLLFHGGHLVGGYLGVDLFFTLSGFLITSLLLAESARTGSVRLSGFWARRARRLLPALGVLMVGVALYCVVFADPSQLAAIRDDALATLAYAANWRAVFAHQSYWALFFAPSPLQHTWSLAIEEQFYLIWPLVFVALLARYKRNAPKAVLVTALALAAVSATLMVRWYQPLDTNRVYYGTDTRAGAILLGAALAAWLAIHGPTKSHRVRVAVEAAGFAGAAVLVFAWTHLDGQSSRLYHGGFLLCGLAATAVIAAAVQPVRGPIARVLSVRPLCALGWISYGVYLYHWPVDVAANGARIGVYGWPLFGVQTAITLTIAIVSYRIIEQPIRHGAISAKQWRVLTPAITIALVVVVFASTLGARPQIPSAVLPGTDPLGAAATARRNAPADAERLMMVGDSQADFLIVSLEALGMPRLALFDAARAGCTVPSHVSQVRVRMPDGTMMVREGLKCVQDWEADAAARFQPQVTLWVVTNPWEEQRYKGQWIHPCTPLYESLYETGVRQEIADLKAVGTRVVMTTTAYWRPTQLTPYWKLPDLKLIDRYTDCDNALRRKIAAETGTKLVDVFNYVCPKGKCRITQDGLTLRPDGVHYAGVGGQLVAQWIVDQANRA